MHVPTDALIEPQIGQRILLASGREFFLTCRPTRRIKYILGFSPTKQLIIQADLGQDDHHVVRPYAR